MKRKTQLSHSRLSTYQQCPRKYYLQFIEKSFPDDSDNPHFVRGNAIHGQIEDYIIWKNVLLNTNPWNQAPSKPEMRQEAQNAVPIIDKLFAQGFDVMPEQKVAVNDQWEKTGWLDRDVRWRGIFDALGLKKVAAATKAALMDWKTGKVRDYGGWGGQLHLSSTILFSIRPEIEEITNAYMYVDHRHTYPIKFKREELPQLQGHFDDEWRKVDEDETYDPKVNRYCGWCPATKSQCPYSRNL